MRLLSSKSIGLIAWQIIKGIGLTLSVKKTCADPSYGPLCTKPVIYMSWHGRMVMPMVTFNDMGIVVLVSEHRDGEIITSSLDAAGFDTVRGSTTRGGSRALVQLVRLARSGAQLAFTPDGPKGPPRQLQKGVVYLAAKSGLPIVPLGTSARRSYRFKSWDSFMLPLPFSKAVLNVGEPYYVTGGLEPDNIEYHRAELERRLNEITDDADSSVGISIGK